MDTLYGGKRKKGKKKKHLQPQSDLLLKGMLRKHICDVIKQNEFELANTDFKMTPIKRKISSVFHNTTLLKIFKILFVSLLTPLLILPFCITFSAYRF